MKRILVHVISIFLIGIGICYAQRDIAITIDDLPLVDAPYNQFEKIVQSLEKHHVPAIGFMIGNRVNNETIKQFELFKQSGLELGNHSYSHLNYRNVSSDEYINDLIKADVILKPFMSQPQYFRYPYLSEGKLWRKTIVRRYLSENNYVVAPVTIDSRDFEFNSDFVKLIQQNSNTLLPDFKKRYLEFVWQRTLTAERKTPGKQILLLHANLLNAYFLDDLLQMFEDHGYHFVSLSEALKAG